MLNNTPKHIYIRALRNADYTVFCVADGQKIYYDPRFNRAQPYSSGQQVKRSIIDTLCSNLNLSLAPIHFVWVMEKDSKGKIKFKEGEALSLADPSYPDQLIGGYMRAKKQADKPTKEKDEGDSKESSFVVKRRSPLCISAMRPLHPLLAGTSEENISFDRSSTPTSKVVVREGKEGRMLSDEELVELLSNFDGATPKKRKYIQDQRRATGLYVVDICIDMERLFCVNLDPVEPEVDNLTAKKLEEKGWKRGYNSYGPCLVCPKEEREKMIPAIANAVINWRITSNQARTFGLMETLAVAISHNAQYVAGAIRARLRDIEEVDRPQAIPVLDRNAKAELFVSLPAESYIPGNIEAEADALANAENRIIEMLQNYNYDAHISS
ncbi:MAG: CRISPR-associated protein Cas7 [Bacteroidia bacterium]|nr:CRISPR-associated protein Cas7 [Bacteroidia bacterium]MDW8158527.1 CRISPR-associated protein Cas7 [Bacteroidia bacterium]